MTTQRLELLLARADDGRPLLDAGLSGDEPGRANRPERRPATDHNSNWDEGKDANDLAEQRWGVIAPQGPEGDRLLDVIAPLMVRRRWQQGGHEVSVFRVPTGPMTMAEAARWKKNRFRKSLELDDELPRYQLILGDLDQVPLAIQQAQATDGFVGRLALDSDDDYRSYVDKLLRWEDRPHTARAGHALLHTVRDGTRATEQGHRSLMVPCFEWLRRERVRNDKLQVNDVTQAGGRRPSRAELLDVAACQCPSVLMSLSHGLGSPRAGWSAARQRREQGALSFGADGVLTGADIAGRPIVPGGVWFLFACYGAGTPMTSAYYHWLETLRGLDQVGPDIGHVMDTLARERPFVAALPKSALANPEGPLAVLGHIDLAWSYSYKELDDGVRPRPGRFKGVLRSLLRRDRAGLALRELTRSFEQVNTELSSLYDLHAQGGRGRLDIAERARRAHLWMLRQDLAGYVLLGDPAARLPLNVDKVGDVQPADSSISRSVADTVVAIEQLLAPRMTLEQAALAHRIDQQELDRLLSMYRRAGRQALTEHLQSAVARSPGNTQKSSSR